MIQPFDGTPTLTFPQEVIKLNKPIARQRLSALTATALLEWDAPRSPGSVRSVEDAWTSTSTTILPLSHFQRTIKPTIDVRSSASPLTDREAIVLQGLYPHLSRAARIYGVQEFRIVVSRFIDPEEDNNKIVVTQWVNLSTEPAFQYWDKMSAMVENWMGLLPESLKPIAERIDIALEWNVTGTPNDLLLRST